jgi:hypothetical protein
MAAKKPQYFALFKSDYVMNREGLKLFKLSQTLVDSKPYILPVNPYEQGTKNHNSFELFRQSQQTFTYVVGDWPLNRDVFDKSEVDFILIEESISKPVSKCVNDGGPWIDTVDLTEVAIYRGRASGPNQEGVSHE